MKGPGSVPLVQVGRLGPVWRCDQNQVPGFRGRLVCEIVYVDHVTPEADGAPPLAFSLLSRTRGHMSEKGVSLCCRQNMVVSVATGVRSRVLVERKWFRYMDAACKILFTLLPWSTFDGTCRESWLAAHRGAFFLAKYCAWGVRMDHVLPSNTVLQCVEDVFSFRRPMKSYR